MAKSTPPTGPAPRLVNQPAKNPKSREDDLYVTFARMCEKWGKSPSNVQAWRRAFADFPKPHEETRRYKWEDCEKWRRDHPEVGKQSATITGKRADLMCENLEKKNHLLDIQIREKDHQLVSVDRMMAVFREERTVISEAFRKYLLSELPAEADGRSALEISELLARAYDRYIEDIQNAIPRIIEASAA